MTGAFCVISYMNENSILLFNYIYFILVLKSMWFIQKKESVIIALLGTNVLSYKIGYCRENQLVIGPVMNKHVLKSGTDENEYKCDIF